MAGKFTGKKIDSLKPKKERYELWETGRQGFGIRVFPSGVRSWIYLYWFEGVKRRMTLGKYPKMSLGDAHEVHAKAERQREKGIDPGVEKVADNRAMKLSGMIESYLSHSTKKTVWKDRRFFEKDVTPKIGRKKAQDVKRRDIIAILDALVKRGSPIQANRGLAAIRRLFNWGIGRDIVEFNPCTAIERPGVEKSRDRVLSEVEIKTLWNGLPDAAMANTIKLVLKFGLVTLQRKGEVLNIEWSEIEGAVWTIPAEKTKNKLTHRVPLTNMALEILAEARGLDDKWVFPSSRRVGRPYGETAINIALTRNLEGLGLSNMTPHDLRRTGASHVTGMGVSRLHVSKILNHVESGVTAVYDRYGYDTEKKYALDLWASKLIEIIEGEKKPDNVVLLNR